MADDPNILALFRELLAVVTSLAQSEAAQGGGVTLWKQCDALKAALDKLERANG